MTTTQNSQLKVKKQLADQRMKVMQQLSRSPDWNQTENLEELKIRVMERPSTLKEVELTAEN